MHSLIRNFLFCSILLNAATSFSQTSPNETSFTIIKLPLSMVPGELLFGGHLGIGLEVEKFIRPKFSIAGGLRYLLPVDTKLNTSLLTSEEEKDKSGLKLTSAVKYYFGNKPIVKSGFFISFDTSLSALFADQFDQWQFRSAFYLNLGILNFTTSNKMGGRFIFELLAGAGVVNQYKRKYIVSPNFDAKFGYAF